MKIAYVLYPDFTALDLVGPYEVISRWPDAEVHFLARSLDPVRCDCGLTVIPTDTPTTLADPDLIVVPGSGNPVPVLSDTVLIDWLRAAAPGCQWTASVCTGAGLYAAAGLLEDKKTTTHWGFRDNLRAMGVEVVADRVVWQGNHIAGAGVSAGIDMALALTDRVHGRELAESLQLIIEYDPQPPFQSGSPDKADASTLRLACDEGGKAFQPQVHYFVGGATKLYGAALYRLRAEDFGELHHHDGLSPAWPIGYEELEPYYTQAELYEVHGARGEDPTEPPASAPYPFPAVSHEPRIQQLADDLAAAGRHPFHAPCGIRLHEANMPYSHCVRCATCDGFPCLVHAKSDAEVLAVRPALEHPNVTLLTNAEAVRLETDDAGRSVTGVVVEHDGERETLTADLVVVSCGAANSAKLLLASATDAHPHGLANGSDQVGRNYMFHASQAVLALSKEPNPTVFQKTLGVNDFYFGTDDVDYPLGNIQMVGKSQAEMFRGEKPIETKLAPQWTLGDVARHAVDFWLSTEDLPRAENRVSLREDGSVVLAYAPTNEVPKKRLLHELKSMLKHLGMHPDHLIPRNAYLKTDIPVAGVAHQAGTCRFGADPATSVLNPDCRAHEVDNLYVVDTSFFPSIGAVNPALTAMANALRVGDHLLERLGASAQGEAGRVG